MDWKRTVSQGAAQYDGADRFMGRPMSATVYRVTEGKAREGVPVMWESLGAIVAAGIVTLYCHHVGILPRVTAAIVTLATGG